MFEITVRTGFGLLRVVRFNICRWGDFRPRDAPMISLRDIQSVKAQRVSRPSERLNRHAVLTQSNRAPRAPVRNACSLGLTPP
jgi:hypothetical protein